MIGLTTQKVTVMEGNNVTLCVNFSSEFATDFYIDVGHLLTNLSIDNLGKSIFGKIFLKWPGSSLYT